MNRFALAAVAVLTITATNASARDVKIDCANIKFSAEVEQTKDGYYLTTQRPVITKIECTGEKNDILMLKGYPGTENFTSTEHIRGQLAEIRKLIASGMLDGLAPAQYPPRIKFVYDMLIHNKTLEASKKTAAGTAK